MNSFTANFTYHMPSFDIKYVGGIQKYKYDLFGDTDATDVKSFQIALAPDLPRGELLDDLGRVAGEAWFLILTGRERLVKTKKA